MKYLLLLSHDPNGWESTAPGRPADDQGSVTRAGGEVLTDWATYTRALSEAGDLVEGAALHGTDSATTVRLRGGRRVLSDGPFADIKEHIIGFYLIDVPNLDAALDWAARMPHIRTGSVEVRPVQPDSGVREVLRRLANDHRTSA